MVFSFGFAPFWFGLGVLGFGVGNSVFGLHINVLQHFCLGVINDGFGNAFSFDLQVVNISCTDTRTTVHNSTIQLDTTWSHTGPSFANESNLNICSWKTVARCTLSLWQNLMFPTSVMDVNIFLNDAQHSINYC